MASLALILWEMNRASALDEFEDVHKLIGTTGAGTKHARQQINQAYVLMLSGQFQGFCRDLHSEGVDHLTESVQPSSMRTLLTTQFQFGRKLDTGNPNPANIGNDFNRFELRFWDAVKTHHPQITVHQESIKIMGEWRNLIAHQSFDPVSNESSLRQSQIKAWRKSCNVLARAFDVVLGDHLSRITGSRPW